MQKTRHIILPLIASLLLGLMGCGEEKELIEIGNDRPFKVKVCYLIGSVTDNNRTFDIDRPDPLIQDENDPFIWRWHGPLNEGIFKLCFKAGTWAQAFVHPWTPRSEGYDEIGREPITDRSMQQPRQGGEDELWHIAVPGIYTLTFNLRDWTYSTVFEGERPYEYNTLYLVGNVVPSNPEGDPALAPSINRSAADPDIYEFEGLLVPGWFKIGIAFGTWDQPWFHPMTENEAIGREKIVDRPMQALRKGAPDELWNIAEKGVYRISFNTRENTYSSEYIGEGSDVPEVITELYFIGNVTPDNPTGDINSLTPLRRSTDNPDVFEYEGMLNPGWFKLGIKNGTWDQPNFHPWAERESIGKEPITDKSMQPLGRTSEDNLWEIAYKGRYRLRFDVVKNTYSSEYLGDADEEPGEEITELYFIGSVTPDNPDADINRLTPLQRSADNPDVFEYEGMLNLGWFKLGIKNGTWDQPNFHPWQFREYIGKDPVTDKSMQPLGRTPDDNLWEITYKGKYRLRFDVVKNTYSSEYLGEN